jgi:hypothetical protein
MPRTKSLIPRPTADELRNLYIAQKKGCPEIARLFERDPTTIRNWLVEAGIPTRSRGSDSRQHFKAGHQMRAGIRHTEESRRKIGEASKGRKPYLRDGEHWLHTVSADQNPNWKGGVTPERQEFYRSQEWKAASRIVWTRANGCCERCGLDWRTVDRKTTPTFHIHHIASFAVKELRAEPTNLALLCRPCHLFVHSKANITREYLQTAEKQVGMPTLFDFEKIGEAA